MCSQFLCLCPCQCVRACVSVYLSVSVSVSMSDTVPVLVSLRVCFVYVRVQDTLQDTPQHTLHHTWHQQKVPCVHPSQLGLDIYPHTTTNSAIVLSWNEKGIKLASSRCKLMPHTNHNRYPDGSGFMPCFAQVLQTMHLDVYGSHDVLTSVVSIFCFHLIHTWRTNHQISLVD